MPRVAVILGQYPPEERARREGVILGYQTHDVEVGIVSVEETPYVEGLTGSDVAMVTPSFVRAALKAEAEGYDAVSPFGMLDLGVEAARYRCNIPVVGPFQSTLRVAALLGEKVGMVVYHRVIIPYMWMLARQYRMESHLSDIVSLDIELPHLASHPDAVRDRFVGQCQTLIERGADVIIPGGVSMCPVHLSPAYLMETLNVPVVEGIGTPIAVSAMLAQANLAVSRKRYPQPGK